MLRYIAHYSCPSIMLLSHKLFVNYISIEVHHQIQRDIWTIFGGHGEDASSLQKTVDQVVTHDNNVQQMMHLEDTVSRDYANPSTYSTAYHNSSKHANLVPSKIVELNPSTYADPSHLTISNKCY